MQGTITDDSSRTAGSQRYQTQSQNCTPLTFAGQGEKTFAGGLLRRLVIGAMTAIVSSGLAARVNANVVPYKDISYELRTTDSRLDGRLLAQAQYSFRALFGLSPGRGDLTGYHLAAYSYPWWTEADFNEGDNVEWVYRYLESQYEFLDDTLYRLLGNNYLLGPLIDPWWHGFDDFYWANDVEIKIIGLPISKADPEWVDIWGKFSLLDEPAQPGDRLSAYIGTVVVGEYVVSDEGLYNLRVFRDNPLTAQAEGARPGDMVTFTALHLLTGKTYPVEILSGIPRWTYHADRIRVDLNAVPEPSTITLLGLAAFGFLVRRRKAAR
jgi:hypothetical protein